MVAKVAAGKLPAKHTYASHGPYICLVAEVAAGKHVTYALWQLWTLNTVQTAVTGITILNFPPFLQQPQALSRRALHVFLTRLVLSFDG